VRWFDEEEDPPRFLRALEADGYAQAPFVGKILLPGSKNK
jgi:hypothetical protein